MVGCVSKCRITPDPGDSIILKGGVTWPNGTMTWTISYSGDSTLVIYLGVDQTWYNGSTWTRPILNGGGAIVTGGPGKNVFVLITGNYVTFDNIEFTGLYWNPSYEVYGDTIYIDTGGARYNLIEHCYFHGWSHENNRLDPNGGSNPHVIQGDTHTPSGNVGSSVSYCVFNGADATTVGSGLDGGTTGTAVYGGPPGFDHNYVGHMSNGVIGTLSSIHDNTVEYINNGYFNEHMNGFEVNTDNPYASWQPMVSGAKGIGLLLYNNVLRHMCSGCITIVWGPWNSNTSYVFNNIAWDLTNSNTFESGRAVAGAPFGASFMANNTLECGPDNKSTSYTCVYVDRSGVTSSLLYNNHLITSNEVPYQPATTSSNQVVQTLGAAKRREYTSSETYVFSPARDRSATVGAGKNLTSTCSLSPLLAPLCQDTTYGVLYNPSDNTVTSPARAPCNRPKTGSWDAGAYQFSCADGSASPTGTRPLPR